MALHKNNNIVPESYYISNLKRCIESAKKFTADVLLLNLLPIADSIDGQVNQHGKLRFDHDIQAYNLTIKKLSHEMSCEYLDLYAAFVENNKQEYLSSDGVHPNSKGHKLLYQKIKQKLLILTS